MFFNRRSRVWLKVLALLFGLIPTVRTLQAEIFYPWKEVHIGPLDSRGWCGLVLAPSRESAFAFRFRFEKEGQIADGDDLLFLVSEVGPQSPDGQYARLQLDLSLPFNKKKDTPILIKPSSKSDSLILEWGRVDEKTVVGRIVSPKSVRLHLVNYFPWNNKGSFVLLSDGHVQGRSADSKKAFLLWTDRQGESASASEGEEIALSFSMEEERALYFIAGVGEDSRFLKNHIYRYKNRKTISSLLIEEKERYEKKRVKIEGLYENVPSAIAHNLFWMILYQPGLHRFYTPAGRLWIFPKPDGTPDDWTIFEWDSFFNALELSVESSKHALDAARAVLETQYPNGNIPNWRGRFGGTPDRSQPPVGGYVVLKLFQKIGSLDFLKYAYPYLERWHAFWKSKKPNGQIRRDGNGDGLLEWGSDEELLPKDVPAWEANADGRTRAMWESGQDDLPNWDDASFNPGTGTLTMNCLDLNSLYTLDSWCLAQMANILNLQEDYELYMAEYERMRELINRHLWNEAAGGYFDRHWDGRFSGRKAASNFYPLLARIPDEKRALRLVKRLLNPKEFWGDYVLPTISRDDPAFKDQQYWRGTVWPPTNYLVYQGLKAYGFDAVASEFAKKSTDLFLRSWENFQLCPENFDARTGEPGGQRHQSWGPLFVLIAIEEYLDFTPWDGFRFGMIRPEDDGKISRISIEGRNYQVEVSSSEVKLREEGKDVFKADGGIVVRHFLYSEAETSFECHALEKREIKLRFLKKGKYQLSVDNQEKKIFKGKSVEFEVPEGEHSVLILLLEEQD